MGNKMKCKGAGYDYSELLKLLKVIADANRLRIIGFLKKKERCVCEIVTALNIPHNLASHHLKALKRVGLLKSLRKGKYIFYRINLREYKQFVLHFKQITGA